MNRYTEIMYIWCIFLRVTHKKVLTSRCCKFILDIEVFGMDIDYRNVIEFTPLKKAINEKGLKVKFVGEKVGIRGDVLTRIYTNKLLPKTDTIARLCYVLKVPASQIVSFKIEKDETKSKWFESKALPYYPDDNATGILTYEPLRLMMNMYLDYINEIKGTDKTVNDLLDLIEPYRRRNGITTGFTPETYKLALKARGFEEGYKSERTDRKYVAKGLIPATRLKIKQDKPLNIRAVYDICNFFGCSIDWVLSYK